MSRAYSVSLANRALGWMQRVMGRHTRLGQRHCVCCNGPVIRFLPFAGGWKTAPEVVARLSMVGSDLDHYACPRCASSDRERHLLLYCQALKLDTQLSGSDVLHFAPERFLSRWLAGLGLRRHVMADLIPRQPGVVPINIQAIPYEDESFDWVIANHVLEHVDDDQEALREIFRVLRPGGSAVLQTPYSARLSVTFEDPGIATPDLREFAYGQGDHVRLYGQDIFRRFESVGFINRCKTHRALFPTLDADLHGVNPDEPLFLFQRPQL